MRIVIAQIRVFAGQLQRNFETMRECILHARDAGASVIVFPEMCVPGYFLGDAWERESFLKDCEEVGRAVAALSGSMAVVFGNVGVTWGSRGEDGRVRKFNALFCAKDGKFLENTAVRFPFWPKTLLPNYREFDDSRHFYDLRKLAIERGQPVEELMMPLSIVDAGGEVWNIAAGVCEDAWADDYNVSVFDALGRRFPLDFFLNINCSPYTFGKQNKRLRTFGSLAVRAKKPLIHVNCVGMQNVGKTIFGFDGSSGLLGADGMSLLQGTFFEDDLALLEARKNTDGSVVIEPALGESIKNRFLGERSRTRELCQALEAILATTLQEWKISRVVVGASGGIDSALSAVLFSRVLGSENVFLVNMPSRFNSQLTQDAAKKLASNLGSPYGVIPIEESVSHTVHQLESVVFSEGAKRLDVSTFVRENIQARDRGGRILAAVAASVGGVFSCNANKTELTVGYSTLYGDEAGFLAPIADLWKRDVYLLAQYYNEEVYDREVIPRETLGVKPSAELSSDQDVTKGLGDPLEYPYHDCLFRSWVETWQRRTPYDCLLAYRENRLEELIGCEKGIVGKLFPNARAFVSDLERWWNLYQGMGAVKRMQAPPVLALTQRAFGFDHREAITSPFYDGNYELLKASLLGTSS
jgi:NAD+ synthase (glutamine-hydrolysing)